MKSTLRCAMVALIISTGWLVGCSNDNAESATKKASLLTGNWQITSSIVVETSEPNSGANKTIDQFYADGSYRFVVPNTNGTYFQIETGSYTYNPLTGIITIKYSPLEKWMEVVEQLTATTLVTRSSINNLGATNSSIIRNTYIRYTQDVVLSDTTN